MNKYQKLLQVLEKEHQVTCKAAGIEETARAKVYFQLLGNLADKETPKKPIDIEFGPCGDLMLCCPTWSMELCQFHHIVETNITLVVHSVGRN